MNRRLISVGILLLAVLAGAVVYDLNKPATINGAVIDPPKSMPDFTLQSAGGPVTLSAFRGKYVLLYFGYTSCPDICPTTLAGLKVALSQLDGQKSSQVKVLFVSVDYKRDTPEKVSAYAKAFDSEFIGLAGTQAQIDQVTQAYGIYYKLNAPDPATGFYSVDHTAIVLVLDPQGRLVMTWDYGQPPNQIASDLENLLRR